MRETIADYLSLNYPEIDPLSFYREVFPSGELDERGAMTKGKYCGIALELDEQKHAKRYTVTDDLSPISELIQGDNFVVISPLSYAGKRNTQRMSRFLYALTFDVDGIVYSHDRPYGVIDLLHHALDLGLIPVPNYVCSSGNGLHIYYLLDRPLALFPTIQEQLRNYRAALLPKIWNKYVTTLSREIQYESFSQGFRAVGSICKDGETRVRAFKVREERATIDYLNTFVEPESQIKDAVYKSKLTLEEAREKYGEEWYQRRIVNKQPVGTWVIKEDLYKWWLRQIYTGASVGHRYYCIMCLAIYAKKCGVPFERVERDAYSLVDHFDVITTDESNHFTVDDVEAALNAYSNDYILMKRDTISRLSAIEIKPNKRNYRKQEQHLMFARASKAVKKSIGELKTEGRPSKKDLVVSYVQKHPTATQREIANALGVSKTTVNKWVQWAKQHPMNEG